MTINIEDEKKDIQVTNEEYWEHFPLALYCVCVKVIAFIATILICFCIIDLAGIITAYFVDYELYKAPFTILGFIAFFGLGIGSIAVVGGSLFILIFGLIKCCASIDEHIRVAVIANRTYKLITMPA